MAGKRNLKQLTVIDIYIRVAKHVSKYLVYFQHKPNARFQFDKFKLKKLKFSMSLFYLILVFSCLGYFNANGRHTSRDKAL